MAIRTPADNLSNQQEEIRAKTGKSKEIPIDDNVKDDSETVQMDFADEDDANSHASRPTKPSRDDNGIPDNKPLNELQDEIRDYEAQKSGKLEYKDLYKQAEFLITILDTGLSTVFKFIAKGKHAADYEMPERNKKLLVEQLTLILAKYQSKFKVEYMFFVGLLALYVPMGVGAIQNRKELSAKKLQEDKEKKLLEKQLREEKPPLKPNDPFYRHEEGKDPEPLPEKPPVVLDKVEVPGGKLKKPGIGRGRRPKAY